MSSNGAAQSFARPGPPNRTERATCCRGGKGSDPDWILKALLGPVSEMEEEHYLRAGVVLSAKVLFCRSGSSANAAPQTMRRRPWLGCPAARPQRGTTPGRAQDASEKAAAWRRVKRMAPLLRRGCRKRRPEPSISRPSDLARPPRRSAPRRGGESPSWTAPPNRATRRGRWPGNGAGAERQTHKSSPVHSQHAPQEVEHNVAKTQPKTDTNDVRDKPESPRDRRCAWIMSIDAARVFQMWSGLGGKYKATRRNLNKFGNPHFAEE